MTFSLVARCARTGQLGVGAITAMVGVGKLVPHAAPATAAIASQATMNPYLGLDGLRLIRSGHTAEQALDQVIRDDPGREVRQCGIIDAAGRTAVWTGSMTPDWSGHLAGTDVMAQGNRLVGPETLEATVEAFADNADKELAVRLLLALEAGEATGADIEGAISGHIYVMDTEEYPLWDIRVDSYEDPVARLRELLDDFEESLVYHVTRLPTRADPMGQQTRELLGLDQPD